MYHRYVCWLVVWNIFNFPFHIWDNPSHWLSYFSGWNHQPDRYVCIANSMSCLFLAPRSAAAAMKAEMFQCVRSPGWPWAPKNRENGGFVGFYGVKDDLTTRITGSLPCSDHNGRPNTIQHVRRWQLGFLQARLQRLTVGTALGWNGRIPSSTSTNFRGRVAGLSCWSCSLGMVGFLKFDRDRSIESPEFIR